MPLLSLAEAKTHLRIVSNDDDTYLTDLISTAEQYVADELNMDVEDLPDAPSPVKNAVRFLLAHWYENREPITSGASASKPQSIPLSFESIVYKYRHKRIL